MSLIDTALNTKLNKWDDADPQKEVAKYVTAFSAGYEKGIEDAQPAQPEIIRCNDRKADKALQAAQTLIDFLNTEGVFCTDTMWVDSKGYALHTDVGYFFDGLEQLAELLDKRSNGEAPEFRLACAKCKGEESDG